MGLEALFTDLRADKLAYLKAKDGEEFEARISEGLLRVGFRRLRKGRTQEEQLEAIRNHIEGKLAVEFMDLPDASLANSFVYQPYGTQRPPDFIVFTDKKVVPIETKFSAKLYKPIWNSNVPRANAFYIFGSRKREDLTFFCGDDIMSPTYREFLYGFFDQMTALETQARQEAAKLDLRGRGFTPSIRSAFNQTKGDQEVSLNYFTHPDRLEAEDLAITRAAELDFNEEMQVSSL